MADQGGGDAGSAARLRGASAAAEQAAAPAAPATPAAPAPAPRVVLPAVLPLPGARGREIAIAMGQSDAKAAAEADAKHTFWATQPVPRFLDAYTARAGAAGGAAPAPAAAATAAASAAGAPAGAPSASAAAAAQGGEVSAAAGAPAGGSPPPPEAPPAGAAAAGAGAAPPPRAAGPIEPDKAPSEVRAEPYGLPAGFEWCVIDVADDRELAELRELLAGNYVEDDDAMFRFAYGADFLRWALTPPGYERDWHVGVRVSRSRRLVASITGVPAAVAVPGRGAPPVRACEVNFLCVDKKLRAKRLAPVLIREVTRRVNLRGVFQAAYTAGVVLPRPVTSARYWHRAVDYKKLVEVGFSALPRDMTMTRAQRVWAVRRELHAPGLRPMLARDVPSATALLNGYLARFALRPVFTEEDVAHWLLPRAGVVDAFVLDARDGRGVTDLVSFYHLPSSVIRHPRHTALSAAYLYYYVPGALSARDLLEDALALAAAAKVDVVNTLDIMDTAPHLTDLKFQIGDGSLQYYLFNWACDQITPSELGLVLL